MKQLDKDHIESALQTSNIELVETLLFIHMTGIYVFINAFIFLQLNNMNKPKTL